MYEVDKIQYLQIGVQGENESVNLEIDMTAWVEEHPGASFYILFKPYNSANPAVPVTTSYNTETKVLTWTVTASVTQVVGVGYTEIRAIDGEMIKKSRVIPTSVENSVTGGIQIDPPEAYEDWVTAILNAGSDAEAYAIGKRSGSDVSSSDPAYHNNSKYYDSLAEAAKTAAETAQDNAERAAEVALTQGGYIKMEINSTTGHLIFSYTEGVPVVEEDEDDE